MSSTFFILVSCFILTHVHLVYIPYSHILTVQAQLSISTSTPTPCYGEVVTVVCHHPEVVSNRPKYFTTTPSWRENGAVINIVDGTIYTADPVDLTCTFLNITITVDHFRNKSFNYSCLLVLAENGQPSGSQTSDEVTVDPVGELVVHTNVYTCTVITSSDCYQYIDTPMYLTRTVVFHYSLIHIQGCG